MTMPSVKKDLKKAREMLRSLQKQRSGWLRVFSRDEELIAGSYGELYIPCGKPTCRCHKEAEGGHFATRLSQWVGGKLKTKIVRVADRQRIKTASDHYKSHKSALRELRKLHAEELRILKRIVELKTAKYE
jgi:hypothetical protein